MNMALAFFCGCTTFVLMMIIKIPIKKLNKVIAERFCAEEEKAHTYKRLNVSIMFIALLLSMICYYIIAETIGISNIKWCCAMKGGAIAIALHALYSQWFEIS